MNIRRSMVVNRYRFRIEAGRLDGRIIVPAYTDPMKRSTDLIGSVFSVELCGSRNLAMRKLQNEFPFFSYHWDYQHGFGKKSPSERLKASNITASFQKQVEDPTSRITLYDPAGHGSLFLTIGHEKRAISLDALSACVEPPPAVGCIVAKRNDFYGDKSKHFITYKVSYVQEVFEETFVFYQVKMEGETRFRDLSDYVILDWPSPKEALLEKKMPHDIEPKQSPKNDNAREFNGLWGDNLQLGVGDVISFATESRNSNSYHRPGLVVAVIDNTSPARTLCHSSIMRWIWNKIDDVNYGTSRRIANGISYVIITASEAAKHSNNTSMMLWTLTEDDFKRKHGRIWGHDMDLVNILKEFPRPEHSTSQMAIGSLGWLAQTPWNGSESDLVIPFRTMHEIQNNLNSDVVNVNKLKPRFENSAIQTGFLNDREEELVEPNLKDAATSAKIQLEEIVLKQIPEQDDIIRFFQFEASSCQDRINRTKIMLKELETKLAETKIMLFQAENLKKRTLQNAQGKIEKIAVSPETKLWKDLIDVRVDTGTKPENDDLVVSRQPQFIG